MLSRRVLLSCSMVFTAELAERVSNLGVSVNCLDPGTVNTKMLYAGWGPCGMRVEVCPSSARLDTLYMFIIIIILTTITAVRGVGLMWHAGGGVSLVLQDVYIVFSGTVTSIAHCCHRCYTTVMFPYLNLLVWRPRRVQCCRDYGGASKEYYMYRVTE